MDLENVLKKLKDIENPTEDQKQAIASTEAMTEAPKVDAKAGSPVEDQVPVAEYQTMETTATGDNLFNPYQGVETTPEDVAQLAGVSVPPTDSEGGETE